MGDCIYNYAAGSNKPKMRIGIHTEENMKRDLSGLYALTSKQYYYFGSQPVKLPNNLRPIIHTAQGHKSDANQEYVDLFINWIESLDISPNEVIGESQLKKQYSLEKELQAICSMRDLKEDE
jgi:hypothetical protein